MSENQFKWMIIKDYIVDNIQNSAYKDGKIESENQLAKKFHVSRMTVRQALHSLQQDGIIYTTPKKGAYVNSAIPFKSLDELHGFSEDAAMSKKKVSTRIILCKKEKTLDENLRALHLHNEDNEVWHIIRLRYLDDKPAIYEESYYNSNLIHDFPEASLLGSIYAFLEEEMKFDIDYSQQKIDACLANELSDDLEVSKSTPLLRILQTTYLKDGHCIEYCYNYGRVDTYTLTQTAFRKKKHPI